MMGFLDNLGKTITQGVDRAKFEADKLQKNLRLQNEVSELKRQIDGKRMEFGDRALELFKAGQFQSATLNEILQAMDALRASVTLKEEELKQAQTDGFVDPTPPSGMPGQNMPGGATPPAQPMPQAPAAQDTSAAGFKSCPNCQFQMPAAAMFCPSCGARVGV
jgi:zinc-ribbon domain